MKIRIDTGEIHMKKKVMLLMTVLVMAGCVLAGCGSKGKGDEKTVSGTFMDKKDFMFTVEDSNGMFYGFNFEKKPEGYENLNDGDQVKVTYTGTISEVDPFDGEIIEIEVIY